jgi:hypothetical protein
MSEANQPTNQSTTNAECTLDQHSWLSLVNAFYYAHAMPLLFGPSMLLKICGWLVFFRFQCQQQIVSIQAAVDHRHIMYGMHYYGERLLKRLLFAGMTEERKKERNLCHAAIA